MPSVGLDPIPSPQAPSGADLLQAGPRSLARGPEMSPSTSVARALLAERPKTSPPGVLGHCSF